MTALLDEHENLEVEPTLRELHIPSSTYYRWRRAKKEPSRRDRDADLAPDLVRRDFTADRPNRLWVTDLTMISTLEGPLWLSAIRDAFSRRVVAWEASAHADADLVLATLEYA
uniref:DDE-type integrase/transposase/recombinase n=1 Tax=Streptomyces sp. NRRL F-5065 TaxID=1463855 RepID=UPI0004C28767